MNILLISVDAFPIMGGVSTMTHHVASSLTSLGHNVALLGPKGSYTPRGYDRNYTLIEDFESNVKHRAGSDGLREDRRITALLERISSEYKIEFILTLHPFYYGWAAVCAGKKLGIPVGTYFHGFELKSQLLKSAEHANDHKKSINTLSARTIATASASDILFANSNFTKSIVLEAAPQGKCFVTGCGVPLDQAKRELKSSKKSGSNQKRDYRVALGLSKIPAIAYVGRLVSNKRVDRILDIVSASANLQALIIGDGPEKDNLDAQARELNISKRCTFFNRVEESRKFELLHAADFIALMSENNSVTGNVEGFGIALLEGAMCGAIPITSGTGGMRDIVSGPTRGIIASDDDSHNAGILQTVLKDRSLSPLIVNNIASDIRSTHNWHEVSRRILEAYNNATQR